MKPIQNYFSPGGKWTGKFLTMILLMVLFAGLANAQQKSVSGKVTDDSGAPVPGATIVVKGTAVGAVTDLDGKFAIGVPATGKTIVISFIGMTTQEIQIGNQTNLSVKLASQTIGLEEVVAIGYGVQRKKLVTGATIQVKGEDIQKMNTVSPMTALQSQSPGVNITKISGEPGAGFKVAIRGIGTIGNSQPLYIVDGVPRGNIDYLTSSDIESIDILKDAASAAIYGARASNGVIMVTTKKGKDGKVSVTYDGSYGVQNVFRMLPLLDAKEYLMIENEQRMNSSLPLYTKTDYDALLGNGVYESIQDGTWKGTNWLKQMQNKNAPVQIHAVNLTGGNKVSTFSIGSSYTNQEGIFGAPVQSTYERYTFRINSEHVLLHKDFDIIKVGENLSFTNNNNHGIATGNMWWNDIASAAQTMPVLPMWASDKSDPSYPYHYAIPWNGNTSNPTASMIYRGSNISKSFNLNMNAHVEIQPIKGLKYRSTFSVNPSASAYRSWNPTYKLSSVNVQTSNNVSQSSSFGVGGWMFENTLNYDFKVKGLHHFNVLAGMSAERSGLGEGESITNSNSVFNDFQHAYIDNANVASTASIGGSPWTKGGILSYFGRINYDYKETYLLTLVMRADGSSNFAQGHRWGSFPSISAGWVATNEKFMESTKSFLDFLKVRGSWGQNGNQSIPGFQYTSQIAYNTDNTLANYYFGSGKTVPTLGAYPLNIPTPNLKWETSEQLDLGFDARLLGSRLSVAFDYYKKTTKGWLVAAPILASWGVDAAPFINGGTIVNKGIELGLNWNDHINGFKYGVSGNFSFNKNEVTDIQNSQKLIAATNVKLWGNGPYIARAQVGQPVGYFWGYKTAGVFQNNAEVANYKNSAGVVIMPNAVPGDVRFVDTNKDGVIDDNDKVRIGDPNPHFIFSLNLNAEYKGFDLLVSTYGVAGNQIARDWHDAGSPQNNYTTEVLGRWHGEGTSNRLPRVTDGSSINQQYTSDLFIENGDYLKISNVTLGYDFKKLFKSVPMEQMRLFIAVQNLYTFTKYSGMDPEIGTSTDDSNYGWTKGVDLGFYPSPRTCLVGISLKF